MKYGKVIVLLLSDNLQQVLVNAASAKRMQINAANINSILLYGRET